MLSTYEISLKRQELAELQRKIPIAQETRDSLSSRLDRATNERVSINHKLVEAQKNIYELEDELGSNKEKSELKQQEINRAELKQQDLETEHHRISLKLKKAENERNEKQEQVRLLRVEADVVKLKITTLRNEIVPLNEIIARPEPKPKFKIDGEYCINGIHLCKNHPPRQLLINGEEIAHHKRMVEAARLKKEEHLLEIKRLEQRYQTLQTQIKEAELLKAKAEAEYDQLRGRLLGQERQIQENNSRITQLKMEHKALLERLEFIKSRLYEMQHTYDDLQAQFERIELDISDLQGQLKDAESKLQYLREKADQIARQLISSREEMLEEMARQELMKEMGESADQSDEKEATADDYLEKLAAQEFAEEQARENASKQSSWDKITESLKGANNNLVGSAQQWLNENVTEDLPIEIDASAFGSVVTGSVEKAAGVKTVSDFFESPVDGAFNAVIDSVLDGSGAKRRIKFIKDGLGKKLEEITDKTFDKVEVLENEFN